MLQPEDIPELRTSTPSTTSSRVPPGVARSVRRGNPWIFESAFTRAPLGAAGDLVSVYDNNRKFVAVGLFDPEDELRVRVLARGAPTTIGDKFFRRRVKAAVAKRTGLPSEETDGYRVFYGESDGLPGVVVDRYADTLVTKVYSRAWAPWVSEFLRALEQGVETERVILRLSNRLQKAGGWPEAWPDGTVLAGPPVDGIFRFRENGLTFRCDPVRGQKTGFFLDQRDNRARVEKMAGGRTVLNVFSFNGGFSLYAARGGAKQVVDVDISARAIESARECFADNVEAVGDTEHVGIVGDAFEVLNKLEAEGRRFDLVIIDPPSFAHRKTQVAVALKSYAKLARLGAQLTEPGGDLLLASCSSVVAVDDFRRNATRAVSSTGASFRLVDTTEHPHDHPITEGMRYLKCIYLRRAS